MGLRFIMVSDISLPEFDLILKRKPIMSKDGLRKMNYWVDPDIPRDLRIIHRERDALRAVTKITVESEKFSSIPEYVPEIVFTVHLGEKPKEIFLFR